MRSRGHTRDSYDRIGQILIAEMASCQLEYRYLAHLTRKKEYTQKASFLSLDGGPPAQFPLRWTKLML